MSQKPNKKTKLRNAEVDTTLHIIKGAIVQVLNTPLTVSVDFRGKTQGRITVEYNGPNPTDQQIKEIEDKSNEIVNKNLPIVHLNLQRSEAEEKFANKVNNTFIYDKFPVPADITQLNVLLIEDWNVNCCPGPHCETTKDVGKIKVVRANNRPQKSECEFVFELVPNNEGAPAADKKIANKNDNKKAPAKKGNNNQKQEEEADPVPFGKREEMEATNVPQITKELFDLFLSEINDDKLKEDLRNKLTFPVQHKLNMLKNLSYSQGFQLGQQSILKKY